MPKKSRIKRLLQWFVTVGRSVGSLFCLPNVKNAFTNVTKNWKEYICFYLAALAVSAGFWMITLSAESNLHEARDLVESTYDYHIEVALLDNEQYANLDNYMAYEVSRDNEYIRSYEWANGGKPYSDGTYSLRVTLTGKGGLRNSYEYVHYDILNRVSQGRREIRFSPLYSFNADFGGPYQTQLWAVSLVWFIFSVLMLVVLFLIRLDHFRFIYGMYMTCGADFPKLMGAAGGELSVILALMWLPSALIGGGLAAALYIPAGVGLHITARAVLITLLGGLVAVFVSVWFPVRRLSKQAPVLHLTAGDNTGLVSSPRRSFYLFGGRFPGKYELYGFWRLRKYYLRLVISAVFFAAVFVSGLYMVDMVHEHNHRDASAYLVAYRPDAYYDSLIPGEETETDEEGNEVPGWRPDAEEAEMIWSDMECFLPEINGIPGVSHAVWKTAVSGGHTLSHLLLSPGQLFNASSYTVASDERVSEGYRWATNCYDYTAIDKLWIDNMVNNHLCSFEGDPYAVLTESRHIIVGEDIYNSRAFSFKPGDTILVAVCTQAKPIALILDPKALLRTQIDTYEFRYESYTVAAVMRDYDTDDAITLGVSYADYELLTGAAPVRSEFLIYMENGTDMDTVNAAEADIRAVLSSFSDWTVTPTGHFFDAQVRALKNDDALVLTLAACLLLISPLVWFFSQLMFYRKRRREFAILRALGAPESSFARIHRMAGGILSGAAFLMTVILTLLVNFGVYFTVNTLLPKLRLIPGEHYAFELSVPALIACALASVFCGFLSCELPYRLFAKRDARSDTIEL